MKRLKNGNYVLNWSKYGHRGNMEHNQRNGEQIQEENPILKGGGGSGNRNNGKRRNMKT